MKEYLKKAIQNIDHYNPGKTDSIYVMGRINHACMIKEILEEKGLNVAGILDNDEKKQGLYVDGIKILAPEDVLGEYNPDIKVFIYSPKYYAEMARQCHGFGYAENESIYIIDEPTEKRNCQLVELGSQKYMELTSRYGKSTKIFFLDCPRGDFYLLSLYFKEYCKKNHIQKYVLVSHSQGLEELANILDFEGYEAISVLESRALTSAWRFAGAEMRSFVPLTIWQGDFRFNPCLLRQSEKFSFIDTFR